MKVGTFNDTIKDLSDELSKELPDAPLRETEIVFEDASGINAGLDRSELL